MAVFRLTLPIYISATLSVSPPDCGGKQATNREGAMNPADFAAELARRRAAAGLSLADLAKRAHLHRGYAGNVEHGHRWPTETVARALDSALDADGELLATWEAANRAAHTQTRSADEDLVELLELAARAEASDVSPATLDLLDSRVDTMARAYTRCPPADLLRDVRAAARQIRPPTRRPGHPRPTPPPPHQRRMARTTRWHPSCGPWPA